MQTKDQKRKCSQPVTPIKKKSPEPGLAGKQWSEKTIKTDNYGNTEPELI